MASFADAIANNALAQLRRLVLNGNQISNTGFTKAIQNSLAKLTMLDLFGNPISDKEIMAFLTTSNNLKLRHLVLNPLSLEDQEVLAMALMNNKLVLKSLNCGPRNAPWLPTACENRNVKHIKLPRALLHPLPKSGDSYCTSWIRS